MLNGEQHSGYVHLLYICLYMTKKSDLPQAKETPAAEKSVDGLPEGLLRRSPKKFIDFVPLC